jgi:hypothetical protein
MAMAPSADLDGVIARLLIGQRDRRDLGAMRCTTMSVRQSNDWIVVRPAIPASRTAATTARANGSGARVSSGLIRGQLRLDIEAHCCVCA